MADANGDWVKLTESEYAKVIFRNVAKEYSTVDNIVCSYEMSRDVSPSSNDYIGLFVVGFKDLHDCIISKKINDEASRKQTVVFNAGELPQGNNDFYQFLYVSEKDMILGASTPFLLQVPAEDLSTVDEDFYIINPPPDECNVAYKVYKKVVETSKRLEEENQTLARCVDANRELLAKAIEEFEEKLKIKNEKALTLFAKLSEDARLEKDRLEMEIVKLKDEKNSAYDNKVQLEERIVSLSKKLGSMIHSNEALEKMKSAYEKQIQDLNEENLRLQLHLNMQACDLAALTRNAEGSFPSSPKELSESNSTKPEEEENFLHVQLAEHESMIRAMEDSKKLCLEELKIQKQAKIDLEKLVTEITAEKDDLKQKLNKLEIENVKKSKDGNVALIVGMLQRNVELMEKVEACVAENNAMKEAVEEHTVENKEVARLTKENEELKAGLEAQKEKTQDALMQLNSVKDVDLKSMQTIIKQLEEEKAEMKKKYDDSSKVIKDMQERLTEAAILYKRQYVEIRSMKKMIKKYQKTMPLISVGETLNITKDVQLGSSTLGSTSAARCSDSDTGEQVSRNSNFNQRSEYPIIDNVISVAPALMTHVARCTPSAPLQFENRSANEVGQSLDVYSMACPHCSESVPVIDGNTNFLLDHLQNIHGQQLCPICGIAFDSSLPYQYMKCHIEAHFNNEE